MNSIKGTECAEECTQSLSSPAADSRSPTHWGVLESTKSCISQKVKVNFLPPLLLISEIRREGGRRGTKVPR